MTARRKPASVAKGAPAAGDQTVLRVLVIGRDLPGASFADPYTPGTEHAGAVFVGVQRGVEVLEEVRADAREVRFELEFRVGEQKDGSPNFLGPFAQGSADDRFFYLSWGVGERPGKTRMFRRLKVKLGQLTWAQIRRATKSGEPLRVMLRLTDAKGGPLCGSAKPPFVAWEAG